MWLWGWELTSRLQLLMSQNHSVGIRTLQRCPFFLYQPQAEAILIPTGLKTHGGSAHPLAHMMQTSTATHARHPHLSLWKGFHHLRTRNDAVTHRAKAINTSAYSLIMLATTPQELLATTQSPTLPLTLKLLQVSGETNHVMCQCFFFFLNKAHKQQSINTGMKLPVCIVAVGFEL